MENILWRTLDWKRAIFQEVDYQSHSSREQESSITTEEIRETLSKIKNIKVPEPIEIPIKLVKNEPPINLYKYISDNHLVIQQMLMYGSIII